LHFPFSAVVGEDPFYILITLFDCLLWSEGARWLLCWVGARLINCIHMSVGWWSCIPWEIGCVWLMRFIGLHCFQPVR
jgi:hypothetical protein